MTATQPGATREELYAQIEGCAHRQQLLLLTFLSTVVAAIG